MQFSSKRTEFVDLISTLFQNTMHKLVNGVQPPTDNDSEMSNAFIHYEIHLQSTMSIWRRREERNLYPPV